MAYLLSGLLFFFMAASTVQHDGKCVIQTIQKKNKFKEFKYKSVLSLKQIKLLQSINISILFFKKNYKVQ